MIVKVKLITVILMKNMVNCLWNVKENALILICSMK